MGKKTTTTKTKAAKKATKATVTKKAGKKTASKTKTATKAKAKGGAKKLSIAAKKTTKATKKTKAANSAPTPPKRSCSPYLFFVKDERPKVVEEHSDFSFVEITQEVARRWKAASKREREKYEKLAAADKERYQAEVAEFREKYPEMPLTKPSKQKAPPAPKAPKKARSAYVFFTKEARPRLSQANPDMAFGELTKLVAEEWGNISKKDLAKYQKMADEDKKRYAEEMEAFNKEHPEAERRRKRRRKDAPTKPRSAYVFYTKEKRSVLAEKFPDLEFGELTRKVAEKWNALSTAGKAKYEKMAEKDKARYEEEMASYVPPTDAELDAEEAAARKRRKEGPTRARSAYLFYTMDKRAEVKEENPELKFGEITQILSKGWADLTDRSKYEEMAEADKERYRTEMAALEG